MKILLRLKAWQLFVLTLIPAFYFPGANIFYQVTYWFGTMIYIGWIFSIGIVMHSLIDSPLKPKIIYFKISCLLISLLLPFGAYAPLQYSYFFSCAMIGVVIMLYLFMFAARMPESVVEGKIVNRSDSLRAFFYIWFFPIGIWYLQPLIKNVLMQHETNS